MLQCLLRSECFVYPNVLVLAGKKIMNVQVRYRVMWEEGGGNKNSENLEFEKKKLIIIRK